MINLKILLKKNKRHKNDKNKNDNTNNIIFKKECFYLNVAQYNTEKFSQKLY